MRNLLAGYTLTETVRESQSVILVRGTRDADGARVVVKMLRAEHPPAAQIAHLRHEHEVLASLDLPEVVRTLGLVPHGRGVALVLEDPGAVSPESKVLAELWSEMDLARKIQTVLLPNETRFRDYEVSAVMVPASTVGGDYYDIIRTDGCDWVMIGDVSGHGITAGLIMMMIQTAIRTVVLGGGEGAAKLTPARVLARVNAAVRSNLHKVSEDHYMTITGLQLEGCSVRYSGLHQDILIYRASSRTVERVETRGMWIGPLEDIGPLLHDDTLELASGDIVLLFTDGITEAMVEGKRFGTDGLAAAFNQLAATGQDSGAILRGLMQNVEGVPQPDDVTMMAVRYVPQQAA